jgi:hypothetical protein
MTYISSCGDLCDDEDIYPCVLDYLIENCPHYSNLREVETNDYQMFQLREIDYHLFREIETDDSQYRYIDELAIHWEKQMKI